jgi:protein-disulfide isomerase
MRSRAFVLLLMALSATLPALAQTAARTAPQGSAAAAPAAAPLNPATATMLQQRAQDFLRKLYAWGPDFQVKAGTVKPSAVPDLYEINVEVSFQGDSESALVYVTKDGRYMVRGEITDMNADPFAAVRQKLILEGSPSKGPADAKVVMVEFGDFQCPSCRQLDLVLRELLPDYPQVRLVFKDFPLEQIHPWAMTAALVGRCAFQQSPDAFWKVHDLIYDNQDRITPASAYDTLLQLASDAGVNSAPLRACVADPETAQSVRKTMAEGTSLEVESTPTTFVNGRTVLGPNETLLRQYLAFILAY